MAVPLRGGGKGPSIKENEILKKNRWPLNSRIMVKALMARQLD